ncbi:hypothetical protein [Streptosporangium sp. NPDC004631]
MSIEARSAGPAQSDLRQTRTHHDDRATHPAPTVPAAIGLDDTPDSRPRVSPFPGDPQADDRPPWMINLSPDAAQALKIRVDDSAYEQLQGLAWDPATAVDLTRLRQDRPTGPDPRPPAAHRT